jgi:hypothetical protein
MERTITIRRIGGADSPELNNPLAAAMTRRADHRAKTTEISNRLFDLEWLGMGSDRTTR